VYVAIFESRIDVLSADYRDSKLLAASSWLDDLP